MIPAWLKRAQGDATRAVTIRCCTKCGAPILVGLDGDVCALLARADPTPIDEIDEAIALLNNRPTYNLAKGPGRKELWPREAQHIGAPRRYPVLPAHECGKPLPAIPDALAIPKGRADDEPPF